ncbi:hypothetical protein [Halpernia sp. GG3]
MQDEITKHTTEIYKEAKNKKHSLTEKIKEISIEIFIIVFAVTLSIWLQSRSEHRHEQQEVNKFLKELRENLSADIKILEQNKNAAILLKDDYKFVLALKESDVKNGAIYNHLNFLLLTTNFNVRPYEGFKSSGKIATIEDDQLKYNILNYYQQSIPNLNGTVTFINTEQLKMQDYDLQIKGIFLSLSDSKIQQKYRNLNHDIKSVINDYDEIINKAKDIIAESKKAE